jgi:hypothetical protein
LVREKIVETLMTLDPRPRCGAGAHHVPGEPEQVAGGGTHRLGVGGPRGALRLELLRGQRLVVDRLLGPRRPGVVDEDVDATEPAHHRLDAEAGLPRIGGIERQHHGMRRRCARRGEQGITCRLELGGVAARQHHLGAFLEITAHDHLTDAAGGAGDDRDLADEAPGAHRHGGLARRCRLARRGRLLHGGGRLGACGLLRRAFLGLGGRAHGRAPHSWNSSSRLRRPARGSAWLTT